MFTLLNELTQKWYPDVTPQERVALDGNEFPDAVVAFYTTSRIGEEVWGNQDVLLKPPLLNIDNGKYEFLRENQGVVSWYFDRDGANPKSYVTSHKNENELIQQGSFTQCVTALFYQQLKFSEQTGSVWQYARGGRELLVSRYRESIVAYVDWPPNTILIDLGKVVVEIDDTGYVYMSFLDKKSKELFLSDNGDLEFEM